MPLALRRSDNGAVVPIATLPFTLGSDVGDDLQIVDPGVRKGHARLREVRGDLLLTATDGEHVYVNGERVAFMVVADGDRIHLVDPVSDWATELVVRDRMAGAFIAPGVDRVSAWLRSTAACTSEAGPEAYSADVTPSPGRGAVVVTTGFGEARALLKVRRGLDPEGDAPRHYLQLLQRLTGAPHPAVAAVLDGGLALRLRRALPWMITRYIAGRTLADDARAGGAPVATVVRRLVEAGRGLSHLHRRGVIHRDVSPGNLVATPRDRVVVIDFGQAILADAAVPPSRGVIGTPGYVAPEEVVHGANAVTPAVDVYGLAAVGYAMLTGAPPAAGTDVLDTLARSMARPPSLSEMGIEAPSALESAMQDALDPDPRRRPTMDGFIHALDFARVAVGL